MSYHIYEFTMFRACTMFFVFSSISVDVCRFFLSTPPVVHLQNSWPKCILFAFLAEEFSWCHTLDVNKLGYSRKLTISWSLYILWIFLLALFASYHMFRVVLSTHIVIVRQILEISIVRVRLSGPYITSAHINMLLCTMDMSNYWTPCFN